MSVDFDSAGTALLATKVRGAHWLIQCDFTSGTQYFTTAPVNVDSPDGHTYLGLGKGIEVEDVTETSAPDTSTLNIRLSIVNKTMLGLLLGDQAVYRGKEIRLYLQLFDAGFAPVGQPRQRWTGVMNPIKVQREKPSAENGNTFGNIELPCTRSGMARVRMRQGMRMTHEQQQVDHPGDMFFEYMSSLVEKPAPWLTVAFQRQS